MSWLVRVATTLDTIAGDGEAAGQDTGLARELRRFNLPIRLALGAAHLALAGARTPSETFLVSLAPCHPGSPELRRAALAFETNLLRTGRAAAVRVNPTYTLHAIDNLALSSLAQISGNHGHAVGLGGAPGQAWSGLQMVLERLGGGALEEALLMAGDQDGADPTAPAAGVALLFSRQPRSLGTTERMVRLVAVERHRGADARPRPDAVAGLRRWLDAMAAHRAGRHTYEVPAEDGDGVDHITLVAELQ